MITSDYSDTIWNILCKKCVEDNKTDYLEYIPSEIEWALDMAFKEKMNQKAYDILSSVCEFAKMHYPGYDNR
jgi:hypothetical protein